MKKSNYKNLGWVLAVAVLLGLGIFLRQKSSVAPENQAPKSETGQESKVPALSLSIKNIKEKNWSGSMAVAAGTSPLVTLTNKYVEGRIAEFQRQADADVPDIREKFGQDVPTANYTIDITAKYIPGSKIESIVLFEDSYTGGANDSLTYKTITTARANGKILTLANVIKKDKQSAFTELAKKELYNWKIKGVEGQVTIPDSVQALTFQSFENWSMDDAKLVIYFGKYEVAAGAFGTIELPLSVEKIKAFLEPAYI
jgi:hypothetical protein